MEASFPRHLKGLFRPTSGYKPVSKWCSCRSRRTRALRTTLFVSPSMVSSETSPELCSTTSPVSKIVGGLGTDQLCRAVQMPPNELSSTFRSDELGDLSMSPQPEITLPVIFFFLLQGTGRSFWDARTTQHKPALESFRMVQELGRHVLYAVSDSICKCSDG